MLRTASAAASAAGPRRPARRGGAGASRAAGPRGRGRRTSRRRRSGSSSCSCTAGRRRSIPSTTSRCSQRDDGKPLPFAKPRVVSSARRATCSARPGSSRSTAQSGTWVSELFPHVAGCVDDLCFIHSMHGTNARHGGALLELHTGSDTFVRPSMGSWVTYGLGTENQNLPGFITICPTLDARRREQLRRRRSCRPPTRARRSATPASRRPGARSVHRATPTPPRRIQRLQLDLLARDRTASTCRRPGRTRRWRAGSQSFELAFRMQTAAPEVLDLAGESAATHKLYGLDDPATENFGRQCLLARRFAERGVRFVQVHRTATSGTSTANLKTRPREERPRGRPADRRPAART